MQAIIQNLGAIKNNKQAIDLTKNFYVFVGDNNSGKTYVSQLLWTIFNQDVIQKFSEQIELEPDFEDKNEFEINEKLIDEILQKYASFLKKELANTYNIENTPYQETVLSNFSIQFNYDIERIKDADLQVISHVKLGGNKQAEFFVIKKEKKSLTFSFDNKDLNTFFDNITTNQKEDIGKKRPKVKKIAFFSAIIQLLLNHKHNTLFLPASRTFYPTFLQYILSFEREQEEKNKKLFQEKVEEIIKEKKDISNLELREILNSFSNTFKTPYSKPIDILFKKLYKLNISKEQNYYNNLLEKLITLMGGNVVLNSLEGISITDFIFRMNKVEKDLPMYMSSSSVNQLTLLYLYLKYWVEERANFLMVDEPEENLNPKNQIKLLEILLAFANQNDNKVLITTHSPILAEAVNNYTYLDVIKNKFGIKADEFIENNGLNFLNPEISISSEKLGVYFFDGKRIIDYKSPDYGAYFRDFKDVSDAVEGNGRLLTDFIYLKEQENNGKDLSN